MPAGSLPVPHLEQEQDYTCVPACVRMVLAFHGHWVSERALSDLLDTDVTGTRFRDIARVAELGFTVNIATGSLEDPGRITREGFPCIARIKTVQLPRYPLPPWLPHAVVVSGAAEAEVFILDPAQPFGPEAVPASAFLGARRLDCGAVSVRCDY
jgi:ABC-type bacteriocin/lantibiotic exporter with double-glycine peptidase domain